MSRPSIYTSNDASAIVIRVDATRWLERYRKIWERNFKRLDALLDAMKTAERPQIDALLEEPKPKRRRRGHPKR